MLSFDVQRIELPCCGRCDKPPSGATLDKALKGWVFSNGKIVCAECAKVINESIYNGKNVGELLENVLRRE